MPMKTPLAAACIRRPPSTEPVKETKPMRPEPIIFSTLA